MSQDSMAQEGALQPDVVVHLSRTLVPGAGNELQDTGCGLSHLLEGAWAVMSPFL